MNLEDLKKLVLEELEAFQKIGDVESAKNLTALKPKERNQIFL